MFNHAFLEVLAEGDAKGRVFTFPIPTYNITKDFDWDDPAIDVLWKVTAQVRHPVLLQLRELRHVSGGHPLHVLPASPGPARPHRRSPWRSAAAVSSAPTRSPDPSAW